MEYEVPGAMERYLRDVIQVTPRTAIVLGSGLGLFADSVNRSLTVPYGSIPGYPKSTVEGHSGELILGTLGDETVLLASGRFHFYEGYDMRSVTLPVRLFHRLGIKSLVISNAAGSVRKDFLPGR